MPILLKRLKSQFPEVAKIQPELLARHFTEAGLVDKAAAQWGKAAHRSLERSAMVEAEREGETIGVIVLCRTKVRPFTDKQIELVQNFAAQAVIAIENARLLNELRQRTKDLGEALDQQTATADVLKVISRSQFDLQLVLDNLIETATSLCGAKRGVIFRADGDLYHAAAFYNATPELIEFVKSHPIAPGRHTITARVALERRVIHVADLQEDAEYTYALRDTEPIRTELGVPMFRGDDLVGVFILYKLKVEPFTDKQIELVTTFADQAVIAIENARLLNELARGIGAADGDIGSAASHQFSRAILSRYLRPCSRMRRDCAMPNFGTLVPLRWQGIPQRCALQRAGPLRRECVGDVISLIRGRARTIVRTREPVQIEDLRALAAYREGNRWVTSFADLAGVRTARRSHAQRKRTSWGHRDLSARGPPVHRQTDRISEELRSPSRHRHRERAVAQRIAAAHYRSYRKLRAANCHIGGITSHQQFPRQR